MKADDDTTQDEQGLSKVRELLFGAQTRELEARVEQLESALRVELQSVTTNLTRQIKQLTTEMKNEVSGLREQIQEADQQTQATIRRWDDNLVQKTEEINRNLDAAEKVATQYTQQQTQQLADELRGRYMDLSQHVEEQMERIQSMATDRLSLGELFREMAIRLEDTPPLKSSQSEIDHAGAR